MKKLCILLIRHGETAGNLEGRYVGRTDEDLCPQGIRKLERLSLNSRFSALIPPGGPAQLFASPMKRCMRSAQILFPGKMIHALEGMQECDFGDFEYRNYAELTGDPRYQAWIDSMGTAPFPGGEGAEAFRSRVCGSFETMVGRILEESGLAGDRYAGDTEIFLGDKPEEEGSVCALVCHGGCIMAIMDRYSRPHRDYFSWQIRNGQFLLVSLDPEAWKRGERALTAELLPEALPESE